MVNTSRYFAALLVVVPALNAMEYEQVPQVPSGFAQGLTTVFTNLKDTGAVIAEKVQSAFSDQAQAATDTVAQTVAAEAQKTGAAVTSGISNAAQQSAAAPEKVCSKWFSVRYPTQQELKTFGIGVALVVVLGSVTYILYKNGTFKAIRRTVQARPYMSVSAVGATVAALAAVGMMYKKGVQPKDIQALFGKVNLKFWSKAAPIPA